MANSRVKWNTSALKRSTVGEVVKRMQLATQVVVGETKRSLNRGQKTRMSKRGRRVGLDPSKPGEPPKKVESDLFKSITDQVEVTDNEIIGRVGTNDVKARRLELGFLGVDKKGRKVFQQERPFLRPALRKMRGKIARILGVRRGAR